MFQRRHYGLGRPLSVPRKSDAVFRLLPGGPAASLIAAGQLSGSKGEPVTFTRASSAVCETASGGLTTLSANLPRVESTGLRVEGGATNLLLYSEQLDNAAWGKAGAGTSVTANAGVSPDGATSADRVVVSGASASNHVQQLVSGAFESQTHTLSLWVKSNTGSDQTFRLKMTHSGVIDYLSSVITATSEWQRVTFSQAFGAAVGAGALCGITTNASGTAIDLLVFGAQLEKNTSVASSYAGPTLGTSASRSADVATVSTAGWPTTAGSVEVTYTPLAATAASGRMMLDTRSSATSAGLAIYITSGGNLSLLTRTATLQTVIAGAVSLTAGAPYRIRATWSGGNSAIYMNDVLIASSASATMPDGHAATASVGCNFSGGEAVSGNLHSLSVRRQ